MLFELLIVEQRINHATDIVHAGRNHALDFRNRALIPLALRGFNLPRIQRGLQCPNRFAQRGQWIQIALQNVFRDVWNALKMADNLLLVAQIEIVNKRLHDFHTLSTRCHACC